MQVRLDYVRINDLVWRQRSQASMRVARQIASFLCPGTGEFGGGNNVRAAPREAAV